MPCRRPRPAARNPEAGRCSQTSGTARQSCIGRQAQFARGLDGKKGEQGTFAASKAGLTSIEQVARQHIIAELQRTGGRIAGRGGAAQSLELHPNTLRSRMKKLGIHGRARELAGA